MFLKNQKKQQEEEVVVINEQMLVDDLEASISNKIVEIFNFSMNNATFQKPDTGPEIESFLTRLKDASEKEIFGPVMGLAHQVDNGKRAVFEYKEELTKSQQDLAGTYHNKQTPTPFIRRFVSDLKTQFYELDQSIKAVESTLTSPNSMEEFNAEISPTLFVAETLKQEQEAIGRLSSKVSNLKTAFDETTKLYDDRIHFGEASNATVHTTTETNIDNEVQKDDVFDTAEKIDNQYKQYLLDKKNKQQKWRDKIDLFGADPSIGATSTATKSAFGSKFGATQTKTQTPSNRPKSPAPGPK